jgi:hypothetical protein
VGVGQSGEGGSDGAYSILWFRLERGEDQMKCCRKMKRRPRACLGSMEKKCDMATSVGDAAP